MTKHAQIIDLLKQGLTPQEVAAKIGCRDAYVRACRAREWGKGRQQSNEYKRRAYWAGAAVPGARDLARAALRESRKRGKTDDYGGTLCKIGARPMS